MSEFQKGILAIDDPQFDSARIEHDNCIKYGLEEAEIYNVDQSDATLNVNTLDESPILEEEKVTLLTEKIKDLANKLSAENYTEDGGMVLKSEVEYIEDRFEEKPLDINNINSFLPAQDVNVESTNLRAENNLNEEILIVSKPDFSKWLKLGALAWIAKIILFK